MASFDAWTIAICAALSLLTGYDSASGLFISTGLGVVAYVEFSAIKRLRQLIPEAMPQLAYNQFALGGVLIVYAVWSIFGPGRANISEAIDAMGNVDPDVKRQLLDTSTWIIYGALIGVAVFVQGGTGLYYLSREKRVREYVEQTPEWIKQMQKSGVRI
jgi:hypothetical protein